MLKYEYCGRSAGFCQRGKYECIQKDFQEIFILFRYLARVTSFKNETELASSIASFARKNDISQQIINDPPAQFYFSKS